MNVREPTSADRDRIAELVESSMTTSYQLSPQQIDGITEEQFGADALAAKSDRETTVVRVAETTEDVDEATVVGYVEGTLDEPWGELVWLFVDPEHRGKGIGEDLFETAREALAAAGAEKFRGTTLEANAEGQEFFERFGLEDAGDRRVEIGDQSLVENVYVDPSADVESGVRVQAEEAEDEATLPGTETSDGATTVEADDDQRLFLDREERESGEDGPFFATYADAERTEQQGYYCSNCGSADVTMDSTDRLECAECGNASATRSSEAYDGSYL